MDFGSCTFCTPTASVLLDAGEDIKALSKQLGHSGPRFSRCRRTRTCCRPARPAPIRRSTMPSWNRRPRRPAKPRAHQCPRLNPCALNVPWRPDGPSRRMTGAGFENPARNHGNPRSGPHQATRLMPRLMQPMAEVLPLVQHLAANPVVGPSYAATCRHHADEVKWPPASAATHATPAAPSRSLASHDHKPEVIQSVPKPWVRRLRFIYSVVMACRVCGLGGHNNRTCPGEHPMCPNCGKPTANMSDYSERHDSDYCSPFTSSDCWGDAR